MPLVEDPDMSLDVYAAHVLKDGLGEIEQKTRRGYQDIYDRHIAPALGRLKVREIARLHVKGLLGAKRSAGLSRNTVRLIKATLSTILSDAMDDGYITGNPCYGAGRKGRRRLEAVTQAERVRKIRPMSPDQLVAFLAASAKHAPRYLSLFATMAGTGLRPGEGLRAEVGGRRLTGCGPWIWCRVSPPPFNST
jgi:integrase